MADEKKEDPRLAAAKQRAAALTKAGPGRSAGGWSSFFKETIVELKKTTWPDQQRLEVHGRGAGDHCRVGDLGRRHRLDPDDFTETTARKLIDAKTLVYRPYVFRAREESRHKRGEARDLAGSAGQEDLPRRAANGEGILAFAVGARPRWIARYTRATFLSRW